MHYVSLSKESLSPALTLGPLGTQPYNKGTWVSTTIRHKQNQELSKASSASPQLTLPSTIACPHPSHRELSSWQCALLTWFLQLSSHPLRKPFVLLSEGFFATVLQTFSFACPRAVSSVTVTTGIWGERKVQVELWLMKGGGDGEGLLGK